MKFIICLIFIAFLLSCRKTKAYKTDNTNFLKRIDSLFTAHYLPNNPGATVLIRKKGKEIYKKNFGLAHVELGVSVEPDMI